MKVSQMRIHFAPIQIILESPEDKELMERILHEYLIRTVHLTKPTEPYNLVRSFADRLYDELTMYQRWDRKL